MDTTKMALMLLEIAYKKGKINEATMRNIREKYKVK